jgi:hypothetical protein
MSISCTSRGVARANSPAFTCIWAQSISSTLITFSDWFYNFHLKHLLPVLWAWMRIQRKKCKL